MLISDRSDNKDVVLLTEEQKLMLHLSNEDIKDGRLILQKELNEQDLDWLYGLSN